MTNKNSFVVNFTGEAEVYWKTALAAGLIPEFMHASIVCITNSSESLIFVWFGSETLNDYEWIPLNPGDWESVWGSYIFDLKAAWATTGTIRAKVLWGWAGRLSFWVI